MIIKPAELPIFVYDSPEIEDINCISKKSSINKIKARASRYSEQENETNKNNSMKLDEL